MTGEGQEGVCEVAWVCAAGCVTRANQFLSGPQFPLWPSEWTKDSTRKGHTAGGSLCTLPRQGLAESRAKKITGFPTKPLYSLAARRGTRESREWTQSLQRSQEPQC